MIIITQLVVIVAAIIVLFTALSGKRSHAARAWKKLILGFLAIAMIVAVIFPDTTNRAASLVGVGRGADLLLYLLTVAFIMYAVNNYLYQQEEKDTVYRLARKLALYEAIDRYDLREK